MSNLKEEHKRKIVQQLEKEIGRPATSVKEQRLRTASAEVLSGTTASEAGRMYAVSHQDIKKFLEETFPTEEDRYKFVEEAMVANSLLAMQRFGAVYGEMSAIDAARAATMFAGKAAELRKARLDGFREPPISVMVIQKLEKNLKVLAEKTL